MNNFFKLFLIITLVSWLSAVNVRVLLDECSEGGWTITSKKGFVLTNQTSMNYDDHRLNIRILNGVLLLNDQKFMGERLKIESVQDFLDFKGNKYQGHFIIRKNKNGFLLINVIDLEKYVFSVLKSESWPGWPAEVNKAFAIACRTYVVNKILEARAQHRHYHVKDSNVHQTYNGAHSSEEFRAAVEETESVILTYNRKPIAAMFDACCGGVIPNKVSWFSKPTYLSRTYACPYCKGCKVFSWEEKYSLHDFEAILKKEFNKFTTLKDIVVVKRDGAGLVQKIVVYDKSGKKYYLTGRRFHSLFRKTRSFCFSLTLEHNKVVVDGSGYGHHMGLCQWGAREMVNRGYGYKDVLQFYYPGTSYMKVVGKKKD